MVIIIGEVEEHKFGVRSIRYLSFDLILSKRNETLSRDHLSSSLNISNLSSGE